MGAGQPTGGGVGAGQPTGGGVGAGQPTGGGVGAGQPTGGGVGAGQPTGGGVGAGQPTGGGVGAGQPTGGGVGAGQPTGGGVGAGQPTGGGVGAGQPTGGGVGAGAAAGGGVGAGIVITVTELLGTAAANCLSLASISCFTSDIPLRKNAASPKSENILTARTPPRAIPIGPVQAPGSFILSSMMIGTIFPAPLRLMAYLNSSLQLSLSDPDWILSA